MHALFSRFFFALDVFMLMLQLEVVLHALSHQAEVKYMWL